MPFVRVRADDTELVDTSTQILNAAKRLDDPEEDELLPPLVSGGLRYGWDLEPGELYLYLAPEGADGPAAAVGVLELDLPRRDNRHLVWAQITTHPDHRRRGHGTAMLEEVLRRTEEAGRSTIWLATAEDDLGARAFIEGHGFSYASHDARRRQVLADVDHEQVEVLRARAAAAAADYVLERGVLERGTPPTPDDILAELVEVTAAINDAPMGDLTYEDEHFDLQRLRDFETAARGRGDVVYRLWARHRETGEIAGHTVVTFNQLRPTRAGQADTAVAKPHRGHRLGLLLKIEMMRWLAEAQPQVEKIETFNNVDNDFMISVNEAIGYRLSRVFAIFERNLTPATPADAEEPVREPAVAAR